MYIYICTYLCNSFNRTHRYSDPRQMNQSIYKLSNNFCCVLMYIYIYIYVCVCEFVYVSNLCVCVCVCV